MSAERTSAAQQRDSAVSDSQRAVLTSQLRQTIPDVLSGLEAADPPSIDFSSQIERILAYHSGVIVGLSSGDLALALFSPTEVSVFEGSPKHSERVSCLALPADESFCVSGSRDNLLKVWDLEAKREMYTLSGHSASVTCVAVGMDGEVIVSGSRDNTVRVWSSESRKALSVLTGHTSIITCLCLTPDSSQVVSGSFDNSLKLWSLSTPRELCKFQSHSYSVYCLILTPDGRFCLSGSADNTIKVWEIATHREIATLVGHTNYIRCLAVTSDGKVAVSGSGDCTVRAWDIGERRELATFVGHQAFVAAVVVTPDNRLCISGASDSMVKVWSLMEFREVATFSAHTHWVTSLALCADCSGVISGSSDNSLKLWTLTDSPAASVLRSKSAVKMSSERKSEDKWLLEDRRELVPAGLSDEINCLVVTPDLQFIVSASTDACLHIWSVASRAEVATLGGHTGAITCIGLTPDGSAVVSGAADCQLKLWSVRERRLLATFSGHSDKVSCLAVSRDGKTCVSGSADTSLIVWSIAELGEAGTLTGHSDWLDCVQLTPDALHCFSSSRDLHIKLWSVPDCQELASLLGHTADIYCLALTPSADCLISASADNSLRVWDVALRRERALMLGHTDWVYCLAVSADGRLCASGAADFAVKLWSLETYRELATFCGHSAEISAVAISADSSFLVSGSYDHSLRCWSLSEKREVGALLSHKKEVLCLALSPSGGMCVSGAADNSLIVQSLPIPSKPDESRPVSASSLFISNFDALKLGHSICEISAFCVISPLNVTSLHISAYFLHSDRLRDYLKLQVPFTRGSFGSPLTVALERKSMKCTDVIVEFLISQARSHGNDSCWPLFQAAEDDIPVLLYSNTRLLVDLFSVLLQKSAQNPLPEFVFRLNTPRVQFLPSRAVNPKDFSSGDKHEPALEPVDFYISLIKANVFAGSSASLALLKALERCRNREILCTAFVQRILDQKWTDFRCFSAAWSALYALLLCLLVALLGDFPAVDHVRECLLWGFIGSNGVLFALELALGAATRLSHFRSSAAVLELARVGLAGYWAFAGTVEPYVSLLLSLLCFLRGFAFFRCFSAARMYVSLLWEVVGEASAYVWVFAYSVAFLAFLEAVAGDLREEWTFRLQYDMEFTVFSFAVAVNLVIFLGILVSVFYELLQKAQLHMQESDLQQRLKLIIEYESLLFWRRNCGFPTAIALCCPVNSTERRWHGALLQVREFVQKPLKNKAEKDSMLGVVQGKVVGLEGRVRNCEGKLQDIDEKAERVIEMLQTKA